MTTSDPPTEEALVQLASQVGVCLSFDESGLLSFGLNVPCIHLWIHQVSDPLRLFSFTGADVELFAVGRERVPPLIRRGARGELAQLRKHRIARITSSEAFEQLIKIVVTRGGSMDNDVVIFPKQGGWILHVNHHEEISLEIAMVAYTKRRKRAGAGKGVRS